MSELWIKDIRKKMSAYEERPPEVDWQKIDQALATFRQESPRRNIYLWGKRFAAAAAATALIVGGARMFFGHDGNNMKQDNNLTMNTHRNDGEMAVGLKRHDKTGNNGNPLFASASPRTAAKRDLAKETIPQQVSETPQPGTKDTPETEQRTEPAKEATPTGNISHTPKTHKYKSLFDQDMERTTGTTTEDARLTAKLYAGNTLNGYSDQGDQNLMLAEANPIGTFTNEMAGNGVQMRGATNEETHVKHHQPVRYGFSVRYRFNDKWSIESGMSYSYLRSDFTASTDSYKRETKQTLHYVGIPMTASYSLWRNKQINVYASVGGMVEKMVDGKTETTTVDEDNKAGTCKESLSSNKLQFSAGASVGAEYLFTNQFGVYVEPGINYYFDNHSNITSIYTDKPLNFNLNLGLRLNIK